MYPSHLVFDPFVSLGSGSELPDTSIDLGIEGSHIPSLLLSLDPSVHGSLGVEFMNLAITSCDFPDSGELLLS